MKAGETEPTWVPIIVGLASQFEQLKEHGGLHGLRDRNVLESALDRPRNRYAYDSTADLADLAAAYAFAIATSHPFNDGYNRAAFTTAAIFLDLNGCDLAYAEPEVVRVVVALAANEIDEPQLAEWIRAGLQPLG